MDTLNSEILIKLNANLDEIKVATTNLNEKLLTEKNMKNIEETFENLKTSPRALRRLPRISTR